MVDFKKLNASIRKSKVIEELNDQAKTGKGKMLATFDCETTGANLFHGDLPFLICITFEDKTNVTFEWDVDPHSRQVIYDIDDLVLLVQYLLDPQYLWIGHNIKFDVRCVEKAIESILSGMEVHPEDSKEIRILASFDPIAFLENAHDTHPMSHAIDNRGSHGLKDLAVRYLDIPEDDIHELKVQVEECRKLGKKLGWNIASPASRPLDDQPTGGWFIIDLWLPRTIARLYEAEQVQTANKAGKHSLILPKFKNLAQVYCLRDTERTLLLFVLLRGLLYKEGLWHQYLMNQRLLAVTYEQEAYGVSIKMDVLIKEQIRFRTIAANAEKTAKAIVGDYTINLQSTEQVAYIIHYHFDIPIERETVKGKKTVNKDELEILYSKFEYAYEASTGDHCMIVFENSDNRKPRFYSKVTVKRFLDFAMACMTRKKCLKAANADLHGYYERALGYPTDRYDSNNEPEVDWYLHSSINLVATDTTRIGASDPNLTNVSKGKNAFNEDIKELDLSLRKVFGPTKGRKWVAFDYAQLQLVIAATVSGEEEVLRVINEGGDLHEFMHRKIADRLGWTYDKEDDGQRTIAKNTNFGFWFGAGKTKIDKTTHTTGLYPILIETFPNAHEQIARDIRTAEKIGYIEASGYRLYPPPDKPYAATVYKVQGWEGKIAKRAAYECWLALRSFDVHLILFVHDELIFEMSEDEPDSTLALIRNIMIAAGKTEGINVNVGVKVITDNWQEGKKVELC